MANPKLITSRFTAPPAAARISPDRPIQTIGAPMAARMEPMNMLDSRPDCNGHTWVAQGICKNIPIATTIETVPISNALTRRFLLICCLTDIDQVDLNHLPA